MSQAEVMEYLKRCKKPKTAPEIAEAVNTGKSTINMNLKKLREHDDRLKWVEGRKVNHLHLKKYFVQEDDNAPHS